MIFLTSNGPAQMTPVLLDTFIETFTLGSMISSGTIWFILAGIIIIIIAIIFAVKKRKKTK